MSLLRCLIREEDKSNTHFGPQDIKDGLNTMLFFMDQLTWPQVLKQVWNAWKISEICEKFSLKKLARLFLFLSCFSYFKAIVNLRREWRH